MLALPGVLQGFTNTFDALLRPRVGGSTTGHVDEVKEKLAKRRANAAVVLLKLNQPAQVWPLLKHSPDPRLRSYLIHRLSPLAVDPHAIFERLDFEPDVTIRRALILALGEYDAMAFPSRARATVLPKLQEIYGNEPDAGLHGAVEWLLTQWHEEPSKEVNAEWARDKAWRDARFEDIRQSCRVRYQLRRCGTSIARGKRWSRFLVRSNS